VTHAAISAVLGATSKSPRRANSDLDLMEWGSEGVSVDALRHLSRYLELPLKEFAHLLPISERTIQRRSAKTHFDRSVSEHILQIAELAAHGADVFGSREKFLAWMREPNQALGGRKPCSLIDSRFRNDMIRAELQRLEHGVVS
jgi:putative toxin-antitoxin system antitoxin component (TIGR02293 family)